MKKNLLLSAVLLGMGGTVLAQSQIETYSVYDVNQDESTTVADATAVVSRVVETVTSDPQVVNADVLNELLTQINENLLDLKQRLNYVIKSTGVEYPYDPDENGIITGGHDYMDLGITVDGHKLLWATCNVGASSPEEYGDYFQWGYTKPLYTSGHSQDSPCSNWRTDLGRLISGYNWNSYKYCNDSSEQLTKYCNQSSYGHDGYTDSTTVLGVEDDVASVNWGGDWRMPTYDELSLLSTECYWEWVNSYNGKSVKGYVVYKAKSDSDKGKYPYVDGSGTRVIPSPTATYSVLSDAHIFLPASGYRSGSGLTGAGSDGSFWSSSLRESNPTSAFGLHFNTSYVSSRYISYRSDGLPVRAVCLLLE